MMNRLYILVIALLTCLTQSAFSQCNTPVLSVFNIVSDSVSLSWTTSGTVIDCEYAVLPTSSPQPASGTNTTSTSIRLGGLLPGAAYKAWIRANCPSSISSSWTSVSFSTPCGVPSTINVTNITTDSADVNWTSVSPGANYQYAVDVTSTPPSSGTNVNANTVRVKGLMPSTKYYAFVRTDCGGGSYSFWSNAEVFFTHFATSISSFSKRHFSVYPNPATNFITITLQYYSQDSELTLFDMFGKVIESIPPNSSVIEYNMSHLPAGMYILKYTDSNSNEYCKVLKH